MKGTSLDILIHDPHERGPDWNHLPNTLQAVCVASLSDLREKLDAARLIGVCVLDGAADSDVLKELAARRPDLPFVWIRDASPDDLPEDVVLLSPGPDLLSRLLETLFQRFRDAPFFRRLVEVSSDALLVIDEQKQIRYWNPAAAELFEGHAGVGPGSRFGYPVVPEKTVELDLGTDGVAEMRVARITWKGEEAFLASLRDVTERKNTEKDLKRATAHLELLNSRLEQEARIDPLTSLLNRRGLEEILRVEASRAERSGSRLIAVLLDLDDFKRINDVHGHATGDAVLNAIATRMRGTIRPTDRLARIGGDEFLAILSDARWAEGLRLAERLRFAVSSEPIRDGDLEIQVTASLGVAPVPSDVRSLEEILSLTHGALQKSKTGGKNRISGATPQTTSPAKWIRLLKDPNAFHTASQPIVRLEDGQMLGVELLARGPSGPFEMPKAFFDLSLNENVLTHVDLQCLATCVRGAGRIEAERYHFNLYPSTLEDAPIAGLLPLLSLANQKTTCLELSEQLFVGDPASLIEPLAPLRDAGIRLAIDDLGFGMNSLESLLLLEPDIVKLDRKLVTGLGRDSAKQRRLGRLVRVVEKVEAEIIAVGVEEESDRQALLEEGIRYGQGYLWGRPTRVKLNHERIPA